MRFIFDEELRVETTFLSHSIRRFSNIGSRDEKPPIDRGWKKE